ncbi:ComF family protein [Corynebacterium kroppenstedtii]|uniref:ComF family protein n=1 Tax=Corynebacterium kroppenstedtii TaxID=161879 RepID=UPI0026559B9E|nr:ComF family protein [Corynebacterium kroppenstedtii]MDN8623971.1 ComF family protein [Corynebacterium kroppenstedtii]
MRWTIGAVARATMDLLLPADCPACGCPGVPGEPPGLCIRCERLCQQDPPFFTTPRLDPGIPIVVSRSYGGVHRQVLLGAKERGRRDARDVCGALMVGTFRWLWANGYLPDPRVVPWVLVPAPTTRRASRQRGGDLVTRWCQDTSQAISGDITVAPVLRSKGTKRDQVGLSAVARRENLSGAVTVDKSEWERCTRNTRTNIGQTGAHAPQVILVDDVVTTGSTCAESVLVLRAHGWYPVMGVALCSA